MSAKKKPRNRRIGSARTSTQQQDLARQVKALKRAGCDPIRSDTASGKSMAGRPALAAALDELDAGDALYRPGALGRAIALSLFQCLTGSANLWLCDLAEVLTKLVRILALRITLRKR